MKPKILYHASSNRHINIFEPRAESVRDENEGPVVFATSDKILASIFIVSTDDSWANSGLFSNVHYFVCGDKARFKKLDKGGAIYTLPPDTFENDPTKGLGTREWTSKLPVKPIKKDIYKSGLDAMVEMGVQVYFVDMNTFGQILQSNDHGNAIIRSLVSENKVRNINIKEVPMISSN